MASRLSLQNYHIPEPLRCVLASLRNPELCEKKKEQQYLSDIKELCNGNTVDREKYIYHMQLLLYMEEYFSELLMAEFDLSGQRIQKNSQGKFLVHIPDVHDERLALRLHDKIHLRATDGRIKSVTRVTHLGPGFVEVTPSRQFSANYANSQRFDVKFLLARQTIQCCQYALKLAYKHHLVRALYPEIVPNHNVLTTELCWVNKNIGSNAEQQQAVRNIVSKTAYPAPYILFGPPGTGKTATLVEAVTQIWQIKPSNNILICTPSNAAADEITKRLLTNIPVRDLHRLYSASKQWDNIDNEIRPCANFKNERVSFLPEKDFMKKRIVIVTLMSCTRLLMLKLRKSHFSYIFIDEAGQATEPEILIPLGLTSGPDARHKGQFQAQVVIAGDPKQLGPIINTRITGILGKSMLERLMEECVPYKRDESGIYNPQYVTKLIRNFRSHEFILKIPNKLFYNDELIACGAAKDITRGMNCPQLPNKKFPIIFHSVDGAESRINNSPSICNQDEIRVIMKYLRNLVGKHLGGRLLRQKDIGIITPYSLQSKLIRQALDDKKWHDVAVGTVEIFQGQERDVIIISTARSLIFKHKGKEHLGFLSNPKRFNVAITRAKSLLITVGNGNILRYDFCWREFIGYCIENNACSGSLFSLTRKLSRTEKQKLMARKYERQPITDHNFTFPTDPLGTSNRTLSRDVTRKSKNTESTNAEQVMARVTINRDFKFVIDDQDIPKIVNCAIFESSQRRLIKRLPRNIEDFLSFSSHVQINCVGAVDAEKLSQDISEEYDTSCKTEFINEIQDQETLDINQHLIDDQQLSIKTNHSNLKGKNHTSIPCSSSINDGRTCEKVTLQSLNESKLLPLNVADNLSNKQIVWCDVVYNEVREDHEYQDNCNSGQFSVDSHDLIVVHNCPVPERIVPQRRRKPKISKVSAYSIDYAESDSDSSFITGSDLQNGCFNPFNNDDNPHSSPVHNLISQINTDESTSLRILNSERSSKRCIEHCNDIKVA